MPNPKRYANHAARQAAYRQRLAVARREEQREKGLPPLPAVASIPGQARWARMTEHAVGLLGAMEAEMQDYYDQRSDAWQESERGESFLERIAAVQEAGSLMHDLRG